MWWKLSLTVAFVLSMGLSGSNVLAGHEKEYVASADRGTPSLAQSIIHASVLDPDTLYHKVWQLISEEFYNPETLKDVGWQRWEHKYDGKLKDMDDAHL